MDQSQNVAAYNHQETYIRISITITAWLRLGLALEHPANKGSYKMRKIMTKFNMQNTVSLKVPPTHRLYHRPYQYPVLSR